MNGTRRHKAHKYTAECPHPECKYTSRIPNDEFFLDNKKSNHSKLCPIHRLELVKQILPLKKKK